MASAVAPLREVVLPARHVQVAEVPAPRPAHQARVLPPVAEAEAALSPPPGPGHAPHRAVEVAGVSVPVAVAAASLLQQGTIIIRDEAFVIDILGSIHKLRDSFSRFSQSFFSATELVSSTLFFSFHVCKMSYVIYESSPSSAGVS